MEVVIAKIKKGSEGDLDLEEVASKHAVDTWQI